MKVRDTATATRATQPLPATGGMGMTLTRLPPDSRDGQFTQTGNQGGKGQTKRLSIVTSEGNYVEEEIVKVKQNQQRQQNAQQ